MAVAFLNQNGLFQVTGNSVNDSTNMSVTASGTNRVAFCTIAFDHTASGAISSVTYGGNSMTSCGAAANNSTNNANAQIFYLINPPTGLNTLVITGNANVDEIYYNLVAFTGVSQTTPVRPGSYTTGTGNSSSASITISSDPNDLTISVIDGGAGAISSTNQTLDDSNNGGSFCGGDDHATTGASSITHTWTIGAQNYALAGFSIQVAGAASPTFEDDTYKQFQPPPVDPIISVW